MKKVKSLCLAAAVGLMAMASAQASPSSSTIGTGETKDISGYTTLQASFQGAGKIASQSVFIHVNASYVDTNVIRDIAPASTLFTVMAKPVDAVTFSGRQPITIKKLGAKAKMLASAADVSSIHLQRATVRIVP